MENAASTTNEPQQLPASPEAAVELSATSRQIPLSWVEKLFSIMALNYGSKFADTWGGVKEADLKEHWAQKLAGYTGDELRAGVAALDTRDWPPTLPEFLKLCRPPIEPATAHIEACQKYHRWLDGEVVTWSRPEVFHAAQKVGAWDLRNLPYKQIEARWREALETAPRTAPPAPMKQIAQTSEAYADPEVRRRVAEGLRNLKVKPMVPVKANRDEFDIGIRQLAAEAEIAAREQARVYEQEAPF